MNPTTTYTTRRKAFLAVLALSATTLFGFGAEEIRLRTRLAGGGAASGAAEYRSIPSKNRSRLNVQVEDVNLAAGTVVDVTVNGDKVGTITISAAPIRGGELELNTQDGEAVPSLSKGALVVVKNGDTAVLSGVLN